VEGTSWRPETGYRAVFHVSERTLTPLADETLQSVTPARDGQWALGTDDRAYRTLNSLSRRDLRSRNRPRLQV
jgi:hypothetical protein